MVIASRGALRCGWTPSPPASSLYPPPLLPSCSGEADLDYQSCVGQQWPLLPPLSHPSPAMLAPLSPPPAAVSALFLQTIPHPCFSTQFRLRCLQSSLPSPSPPRCCSCSFSSPYSSSFA